MFFITCPNTVGWSSSDGNDWQTLSGIPDFVFGVSYAGGQFIASTISNYYVSTDGLSFSLGGKITDYVTPFSGVESSGSSTVAVSYIDNSIFVTQGIPP